MPLTSKVLATVRAAATTVDLAALLDVRHSTLIYYANRGSQVSYTSFSVVKKSGALRRIDAPFDGLKSIQRKIASLLSSAYQPPNQVHGFVEGRSALTNAIPHVGRTWVLNLDLADYFPSINFGRVRGMLRAAPYLIADAPATVLARICCFKNSLPQGAPSSPVLANMVTRALDTRLRKLAYQRRVTYTRYADDVTFSGHSKSPPLALARLVDGKYQCGDELQSAIVDSGFALNVAKFRVQVGNMRRQVTGIVVNEHCNVRRQFVREIRAMLHAWDKFGYVAAAREYEKKNSKRPIPDYEGPPDFANVVRGKISYLSSIKGGNTDVVFKMLERLERLDPRPALTRSLDSLRTLRMSNTQRLAGSTFVLECDVSLSQGTGFFVSGVEHMITCAHVVGQNTRAYAVADPQRTYLTELVAIDRQRDLALLRVLGLHVAVSERLNAARSWVVGVGDTVTVAGFPRHAPGASMAIAYSQVSQLREREKYRRVAVSSGIVSGMSGGPVLNSDGGVVGIVATGVRDDYEAESIDTDYGFIPWEVFATWTETIPANRE